MLTRDDFTSKFGCDDGEDKDLISQVEANIDEACRRINELGYIDVKAIPVRLDTSPHNPILRIGWERVVDGAFLDYEDVFIWVLDEADAVIDGFCESLASASVLDGLHGELTFLAFGPPMRTTTKFERS